MNENKFPEFLIPVDGGYVANTHLTPEEAYQALVKCADDRLAIFELKFAELSPDEQKEVLAFSYYSQPFDEPNE